jgi:predicted Zn-dependent protease
MTSLAGCTPEMQSLMIEYKDDWVAKKTKEVGIGGMVTGVLWGTTGDDEADAALDAYTAVSSIVEGDKLIEQAESMMDQGNAAGAWDALEKARKARPNDWSYMHKEMAWDFATGKTGDAVNLSEQARSVSANQGANPVAVYSSAIDELTAVQPTVQEWPNDTKRSYFTQLSQYYSARADEHQKAGNAQQAASDAQMAEDMAYTADGY